jgi:hypothetical protein
LFGRDRLASQTQLLDARGLKLREGSTIIFSAHPTGGLLVQGEQTLGQVEAVAACALLCGAYGLFWA